MTPLQTRLVKWGAISLVLIILVWSLGPYLAIGNTVLLGSLTSRLSLTLLIIIGWSVLAGKSLYENRDPSSLSLHGTQQEIINSFCQQTRDTLSAIEKMLPFSWLKRSKRPWILLMGECQSGKTTLLAHTGITFQSPQQRSLSTVRPTQSIDWWASDEVVFADPAGSYCLPLEKDPEKQALWYAFLKTVKHYRQNRGFDGVVITLDFSTLAQNNTEALIDLAEKLQQQIIPLMQDRRTLPITLVISRCDQIYGFSDFFNDLGPEEREQHFGFSLQNNSANLPFSDFFRQRAQDFIKRLSERLIWRMHQEQNITVRTRIKDFPSQLEQLTTTLESFVDRLPHTINTTLHGVYFCSSLQSDQSINLLTQSISDEFRLSEIKTPALLLQQKPYFIFSLFQSIIHDAQRTGTIRKNNHPAQALSLPIAVTAIMLGVLVWHFGYRENRAALQAITQSLTTVSQGNIPWLSKLNTLNDILANPQQRVASYYRWVGFSQTHKLREEAKDTYDKLLRISFTSYLNQLLVSTIKKNVGKDPVALYNALQVYLMFSQPEHLNPDFIKSWFNQLWTEQFPNNKKMRQHLTQHLDNLLSLDSFPWLNNPSLVKGAQTTLKKYPLENIAFLILQGEQDKERSVALFENTGSAPGLDMSQALIPALYAEKNFKSVYQKTIPELVRSLQQGNWVIGPLRIPRFTISERDDLIKKIKLLYLKNTVQTWQAATQQVTLTPPTQWSEALAVTQSLRDTDSPFWGLLRSTVNNITINSKEFANLNSFLEHDDTYKATQLALQNFYEYLYKIANAPAPQTVYDAATERMKNSGQRDAIANLLHVAKQAPKPINQWLTTLAQSSWDLMLHQTKQYLNTIWTSSVLPAYNTDIKNRYPIFKDAPASVQLSHFTAFFGPGGTMEVFFNHYLRPFVNTKEFYWTWKHVDNRTLSIPQPTLEMLIRASMIQRMFYQDSTATPSVNFSLTPLRLSPNVSRFTLNLGGQRIADHVGSIDAHTLHWPGPDANFVRLSFNTLDKQQPSTSLTGEWAWFRLLTHSAMQGGQDPKTYTVTFRLGAYSAEYQLTADARVNPYLTNVLSAFRCPVKL